MQTFCFGSYGSKYNGSFIGETYGDVECLMCATGYWSAVQINCDDSAKESISLNHRDLGMDLVKHVPDLAKKQKPRHPCFLTSWVHVVPKIIICILDFIQYAAFRVPAVQNIPQRKNSHIAAHSNCSAYVQCAGLVVSTTHMTFNRTCCGRIVFTTLVTHTRRTHIRHHCKRAHQETNVIASCGNVFITCLYHCSICIWSDMFVMQFCTCFISWKHGHSSNIVNMKWQLCARALFSFANKQLQCHWSLLQAPSVPEQVLQCSRASYSLAGDLQPDRLSERHRLTCNWYHVNDFHDSHGVACHTYLLGMNSNCFFDSLHWN